MEKRTLSIIVAIVVVAVLAFSIYQFSGSLIYGGTPEGCTDTDDGTNYTVKGTVSYTNRNVEYVDECIGVREMREYYCLMDSKMASKRYFCENGCSNGVCNK